jgi:hypothetical protein
MSVQCTVDITVFWGWTSFYFLSIVLKIEGLATADLAHGNREMSRHFGY